MESVSFWGLCKLAILSYFDRVAGSLRRRGITVNFDNSSPALADGFQRKRNSGVIFTAASLPRPDVEPPVEESLEPLAHLALDVDD